MNNKPSKINIFKTSIIFIVLTIVISIFLFLIDYFDVSKYIKFRSNNDWLSYIGAIIGGLSTVLGVLLTIKYEKESRIKENSILYRPVLEPNLNKNSSIEGLIINAYINQLNVKDNEYQVVQLVIKNRGRGEAKKIELIKKDLTTNLKDISYRISKIDKMGSNAELLKDGSLIFNFNLPKYTYTKNRIISNFEVNCELYIKYSDLFDCNNYVRKLFLVFSSVSITPMNEIKIIKKKKYYKQNIKYNDSITIKMI